MNLKKTFVILAMALYCFIVLSMTEFLTSGNEGSAASTARSAIMDPQILIRPDRPFFHYYNAGKRFSAKDRENLKLPFNSVTGK